MIPATLTPGEVALAARIDPGELGEPGLCPCDRGYLGHYPANDLGHSCEYDPAAVERLNFRRWRPQLYRDSWRRVSRWCDFTGSCVVCGRRCYSFRDGEDDPRGPLGDHADSSLIAEEYDDIRTDARFPASLPAVPACFLCMNDEPSYREAVRIALRRWRKLTPGAGA